MQTEKIAVNLEQQSTLAKLLAQENIHVIHGNYRTAWFQPEQRVLALPIWKNRGKAVYDLLTGHEVGHALFTPARGWHDAVDEYDGAPKAYLNVLEDVRIERKVQDLYPGLRHQFQKGYKTLADEDFFGLNNLTRPMSDMLLIDRINLKTKIGAFIEVEFKDEELPFLNASYQTETFEDVVRLAKKIYAYQRKVLEEAKKKAAQQKAASKTPKQPKQKSTPPASKGDIVPDETVEIESADDYVNEKDREELAEKSEQTENSPVEKPTESELDKTEDKVLHNEHIPSGEGEKKELEADEGVVEGNPIEEKPEDDDLSMLDSLTDQAFRQRESELVASTDDLGGAMVYTMNDIKQKDIVIDYKEYYAQWKLELRCFDEWRQTLLEEGLKNNADNYAKFKRDTEQAAAYMAKEFELRKAAYQYSRSTVHKTGLLNTNKLHSYKTSEDLFLRSTKLANYKNHGMMMFIDFSGSMASNIAPTIRQVLNLAAFCRMINIPYEVYAFTTRVKSESTSSMNERYAGYMDSEIVPQSFNLLNLMSSRMSRTEYHTGMNMLWNLSMAWDNKINVSYISRWNQLHSTPLNTCIAYAEKMVKTYKAKHNVERMNLMFLTDGDSDSFQVRMTEDAEQYRNFGGRNEYRGRKAILRINGKTVSAPSLTSAKITEGMLKNLGESTNSTLMGFFITEYRNQAIGRVCDVRGYGKRDKYTEQITKNRALIEDDIFGYDRYFGLCSKYIDVTEDEFGELVEDGASKGKIKNAFAKAAKTKRVNRILLNALVDAIA